MSDSIKNDGRPTGLSGAGGSLPVGINPNPLERLETSLTNRGSVALKQGFLAVAKDYSEQLDALKKLSAAYYELLFAVANRRDGETRHQTALRYILERENGRCGVASEANTAVSQSATSADPLKPSRQSGG